MIDRFFGSFYQSFIEPLMGVVKIIFLGAGIIAIVYFLANSQYSGKAKVLCVCLVIGVLAGAYFLIKVLGTGAAVLGVVVLILILMFLL